MLPLEFSPVIRKRTVSGPKWIASSSSVGGALKAVWQRQLQRFDRAAGQNYISPMAFVQLYAQIGNPNAAFEWLDRAYNERSRNLLDLKLDPNFDSLRPDSRCSQLLMLIGLP